MLMKRLATWPPSKTQSTVSPANTLATFSSGGSSISVDCRSAARTTGGAELWDTTMVRGAFGSRCFGIGCAWVAGGAERAEPRIRAMGISGFTASPFWLHGFALGKALDAFGEPVFSDQLRP